MPFDLTGRTPPPTVKHPGGDAKEMAVCHRLWVRKQCWHVSKDKTLWAAAVQPLINEVGFERCEKALLWYHGQFPRAVSLKLFTMKDFVKFFNLLEAKMAAEPKDLPDHPLLPKVYEQVVGMGWPEQTKRLRASVNLTLHTADTISQALRHAKPTRDKEARIARTLAMRMTPLGPFVVRWFAEVHDIRGGWDGWSGSLKRETIDSPRADCFRDWCVDEVSTHYGPQHADDYLDSIWAKLDAEFLK